MNETFYDWHTQTKEQAGMINQLNSGRSRSLSVLIPIMLCGLGVLLQGCGLTRAQKQGISAFGTAAGTLGEITAKQFPTFRSDVVEMNKMTWVLDQKQNKLDEKKPDGSPADRQFYVQQLQFDEGISPVNVTIRTQAANVLADYGSLLATFAKDTSGQTDLKSASDKLVASVKTYSNGTLSSNEVTQLGVIVQVVGGWWIDWKKKQTVRKVVPIGSRLIVDICNDLETDFDEHQNGMAKNVDRVQDRLELKSEKLLRMDFAGNFSDRLLEVNAFNLAVEKKMELDTASGKTLSSINALRKADAKLVALMKDGNVSWDDIEDFCGTVKELADALNAFVQ